MQSVFLFFLEATLGARLRIVPLRPTNPPSRAGDAVACPSAIGWPRTRHTGANCSPLSPGFPASMGLARAASSFSIYAVLRAALALRPIGISPVPKPTLVHYILLAAPKNCRTCAPPYGWRGARPKSEEHLCSALGPRSAESPQEAALAALVRAGLERSGNTARASAAWAAYEDL